MIKRYLTPAIESDLNEKKIIFIGGPRQVGKTTLSQSYLKLSAKQRLAVETHPAYLNWDDRQSKSLILKGNIPQSEPLLIFDEIHKYKNWRSLLKGFYDKNKSSVKMIVTGSARLDHFRKGGDSLLGRYHYFRLHPFSLMELTNGKPTITALNQLLKYGGFPEPLFKAEDRFVRRWHLERRHRVINDDLNSLYRVKELSLIELLAESLPERVGAPLSVRNLKELLQVSHETAENWISILESVYYCYRISPFGSPKIRAVKKEQKLYLWDWSEVEAPGFRFENLVAGQLLKYCHYLTDVEGYPCELRYIRDTDKREIDFVVLKNKKPIFAVECKTGEKNVSPHIHYFKARTSIPKFYQVHLGGTDYSTENGSIRILPFTAFCKELAMP